MKSQPEGLTQGRDLAKTTDNDLAQTETCADIPRPQPDPEAPHPTPTTKGVAAAQDRAGATQRAQRGLPASSSSCRCCTRRAVSSKSTRGEGRGEQLPGEGRGVGAGQAPTFIPYGPAPLTKGVVQLRDTGGKHVPNKGIGRTDGGGWRNQLCRLSSCYVDVSRRRMNGSIEVPMVREKRRTQERQKENRWGGQKLREGSSSKAQCEHPGLEAPGQAQEPSP